MGLRSWLDGKLTRPPEYDLSPRRIRLELARQRAAETSGEAWTGADQQPRPDKRELDDIAGPEIGGGGTRTVEEDPA